MRNTAVGARHSEIRARADAVPSWEAPEAPCTSDPGWASDPTCASDPAWTPSTPSDASGATRVRPTEGKSNPVRAATTTQTTTWPAPKSAQTNSAPRQPSSPGKRSALNGPSAPDSPSTDV